MKPPLNSSLAETQRDPAHGPQKWWGKVMRNVPKNGENVGRFTGFPPFTKKKMKIFQWTDFFIWFLKERKVLEIRMFSIRPKKDFTRTSGLFWNVMKPRVGWSPAISCRGPRGDSQQASRNYHHGIVWGKQPEQLGKAKRIHHQNRLVVARPK